MYETVMGMEIHVELSADSKVFCGCSAHFGAGPNENVCPICLGLPGTLPVLNKKSLEYALKASLALHCEIPEVTTFDRKNYYYPDLPKNYQISQQYHPIGRDGFLVIPLDGATKTIGIDNVHLEEDAGKNIHPEGPSQAGTTLVDLNRAGVSLLEIVSKPDLRTFGELEIFMNAMRSLLRYIDVSDCKIQEGSMRFELNISIRPKGETKLGTKVEVKNVGSVRSVLRAAEYEFDRQVDTLDMGGLLIQETRLWDDDAGETRPMRSKETAKDYRYFPEPDLVPIVISEEWKNAVRETIPELPLAKRDRFIEEFGISVYDATVLSSELTIAEYFEACCRKHPSPKILANWITTNIMAVLNEQGVEIKEFPIQPDRLTELVRLIEDGTISSKIAKAIFSEMLECFDGPKEIVEAKGLVQISDSGEIEKALENSIRANPKAAEEFAAGKDRALGRIIGEVMKATKGKANPQMVRDLAIERLRG